MIAPALPDVRPAPQAGCFVSGLKLSKDSAQSDLRHRAFRTVAIAPSSGVLEIPAQAKAGAEIKSKGVRRLATSSHFGFLGLGWGRLKRWSAGGRGGGLAKAMVSR